MKTFSTMRKKLLDAFLSKLLLSDYYFSHQGFCVCCDEYVTFESHDSWLRDNYFCTHCKCIPRERALMATIEKCYPNWNMLRIHEASPVNRGASTRLSKFCVNYSASQYYPTQEFGEIIGGFRNENLENLTFKNESFDLVITQDVLEHIYHPEIAFKEIARILAKGGAHIFTVPIINKHKNTEIWATLNSDGSPNFLHKIEYHGNPVDPFGSPVTMHWGFDIVNCIEKASGLKTDIFSWYDKNLGIMGEYNEVFVTRKPVT